MIRLDINFSNPAIDSGTFKIFKELKRTLFNKVKLSAQAYRYTYMLGAFEARLSTHICSLHVNFLSYGFMVSAVRLK